MPDIAEQFPTGGWEFTPDVVDVFPEHVRASVPYYDDIQQMIAEVGDWVLPNGGVYADLGASTGATLAALYYRHPDRQFTAHLYDESGPMLDRAKATLNGPRRLIYYHQQRIQEPYQHEDADLTTCLFTLQFLPLSDRREVLALARKHAAPTGVIVVAEKIRPLDPRWAEIANDRSHDWKAAHGIGDDAIRAKARALRGVLVPHPESTLRGALADAGWRWAEVLFCWHSWLVIGAFAS
ncbi:MAG TPA: methyltransferase [Propionibacteriaceae bacterium]|nr:methyltransferase [Propionibacteriaceae bacterium]